MTTNHGFSTKSVSLKRASCWFLLASIIFAQHSQAEQAIVLPAPLSADDFIQASKESIKLGQLLFFDPILSGNKNIACATCHHPDFGTADGLALSIGEGGDGLGVERRINIDNPPEQRIGRNAPALFNLSAKVFTVFFHDGRLALDRGHPAGIRSPLGADMTKGFTSLLSAQAMFPVVSPDEMAGHYNENEISKAIRKGQITGVGGAWQMLANRLQENAEYVGYFKAASRHIKQKSDIQFTDIANAIADFIGFEWQAINSPFDRYLRGNLQALSVPELQGLQLFYGKAGCSNCHLGALQTDHQFHAIAMPQFGPGKIARFETGNQDTGRMRVTGDADDAYKFRTPTLRNVALTAPYGHDGAFATLKEIITHHLDPIKSLRNFDYSAPALAKHESAMPLQKSSAQEIIAIENANELKPVYLESHEIQVLESFLRALTDENKGKGRLGKPKRIPSGLVFD